MLLKVPYKNWVDHKRTQNEIPKPTLTRSLGRPKNRWEDDVKSDIIRMKITNWKDCIRDRTEWKTLVEKAKTYLKL